MKLGNVFPEHRRLEHARSELRPGRVLYLHCDFTNPPKDKYVVVAALRPKPLLLLINSRIHPYLESKPVLRACQVTLTPANHPFLDHESYLNCAEVHADMTEGEILSQLAADIGRIRGELTEKAQSVVVDVIRAAKPIIRAHKQAIEDALS